MTSKRDAALKVNTSLNAKVSNQKDKIKKFENERFKEVKASRIAAIQKEAAHKLVIASLVEEYSQKIEEAVEYANNETAKKLEAEKARIMSDDQQTTRLRNERQRSSDKLKKERAGQAAVVDLAHQSWIKNLASNLASQQRLNDVKNSKLKQNIDCIEEEISDERKFNEDW